MKLLTNHHCFYLTIVWSDLWIHVLDFPSHRNQTWAVFVRKILVKKNIKKIPHDHWFKNLNWAIYTTETKYKRLIPSCFSACPPMPTACLVIITFSSPRGQYCLSLSQAIKQKNVAGFFYFPTHHCVCFSLLWRDTPHTHPKNVGECVGEPFPSLARKLVHKNVYLERLCPGYGLFTAVK